MNNYYIGHSLTYFETLESTNSYLIKRNYLPHGYVVATKFQTKGKGQRANIWQSNDSENILMSFLVKNTIINSDNIFFLSVFVALGIVDYLNSKVNNVSIKWSNDIFIGNNKIAGILIENRFSGKKASFSVIGIGLNINQMLFSNDLPNPTSLKLETNKSYDIKYELSFLLKAIDKRYEVYEAQKFETLIDDYNKFLWKRKCLVQLFHIKKEKTFEGTILSVDKYGKILIRQKDKESSFYFNELRILSKKNEL